MAMGIDATICPLTAHLLWNVAATIWKTRNQTLYGAIKRK